MVRALEKVLEAGELPNLKLLKIDPEKDKVEYIVENDTLKIKKVNTEEK